MARTLMEKVERKMKNSTIDLFSCSVSVEELASFLSITPRRLQQLVKEGLPKERNGKYPLIESVRWYINYLRGKTGEQAESVISDRQRLLKAQSDKLELENKKLAGMLLEIEEVESVTMEAFSKLKAEILGLPGRLSMEMVGKNVVQIKTLLDIELRRVLNDACAELKRTTVIKSDSDDAESSREKELPSLGGGEKETWH